MGAPRKLWTRRSRAREADAGGDPKAVDALLENTGCYTKLYNRFNQTQVHKLSEDTQTLWKQMKENTDKSLKGQEQRKIIKAWIIDPGEGAAFAKYTGEMLKERGCSQKKKWLSRKQLLDMFSDSEAEEQVRSMTVV